jgi:hypothetical protein
MDCVVAEIDISVSRVADTRTKRIRQASRHAQNHSYHEGMVFKTWWFQQAARAMEPPLLRVDMSKKKPSR